MNDALLDVARRCLTQLAQIEPRHIVLVVTDPDTEVVGQAFAVAAAELAAECVTLGMATRQQHGQEPPAVVAAAMANADVIVQAVKYSLTHTDATRAALARNAQVFVLRGATEEMLLSDIVNVDFAELRRVTQEVARRLSAATSVRVSTAAGTSLELLTGGREAVALAGGTSPGRFGGPRSGEAAIAPLEGSANGTLIVEHSMDNLGLLDAPIALEVIDGRVVGVSGGASSAALERLLERSDANATNLAEFAIGTNPNATLTGNLATDKKVRGSAHIALGDNVSLGGVVRSDLHIDGMLLKPTVWTDDSLLVEDGRLVIFESEAREASTVQGGRE